MRLSEKQTFFNKKYTFFRFLGDANKKTEKRDSKKESRMVKLTIDRCKNSVESCTKDQYSRMTPFTRPMISASLPSMGA